MNRPRGTAFAVLIVAIAIAPFLPALFHGEIFVVRDHLDFFAPLRFFTSSVMRSGELPLWNPLNASGERWLANPETAVFYPPAWFFLVLPFTAAYTLFLAIHVAVLGVGSFLVFRRRTSDQAALFGAAAVMLSGPTLSLLDTSNVLTTLCWIPWVIWTALELSMLPLLVPVAALSLLFLGGEPALAPVGVAAFVAIAIVRRDFLRSVAVIGVALLVTAVQLVPFAEMLIGSDRSGPQQVPLQGTLSFRDLLATALSPASGGYRLQMFPTSQQFLLVVYVAPVLLFCALIALAGFRRLGENSAETAGWSAFTLVLIAMSMIRPDSLPVTFNRYPAKFLPAALIGIGALAVIGFHGARRVDRRLRLIAAVATSLFAVAAIVVIERGTPSSALLHLAIAIFWIGVCFLVAFVPERLSSRAVAVILTAAIAIDGYAASRALFRSGTFEPLEGTPLHFVSKTQKVMRLIDPSLVSHQGLNRREWATGYQNLYAGVFDVSSPSPVVSKRYLTLLDDTMSRPRQDVAEWLSAGFVVTSAELHGPTLQRLGNEGEVAVYRDYRSLPMATLWDGFLVARTDEEAQAAIMSGRFDAVERIVVTDTGELARFVPAERAVHAQARVTRMRLNEVEVRTSTDGQAIVSLNQMRARGWELTMDGKPHAELTVNGMFRGAIVPRGTHVFLWRYRPRFLYYSALLAVTGIAIAVAELALRLRRRRRSARL